MARILDILELKGSNFSL